MHWIFYNKSGWILVALFCDILTVAQNSSSLTAFSLWLWDEEFNAEHKRTNLTLQGGGFSAATAVARGPLIPSFNLLTYQTLPHRLNTMTSGLYTNLQIWIAFLRGFFKIHRARNGQKRTLRGFLRWWRFFSRGGSSSSSKLFDLIVQLVDLPQWASGEHGNRAI